jgi:stearoyl-CoA desaturase (delta-9 desaturase)
MTKNNLNIWYVIASRSLFIIWLISIPVSAIIAMYYDLWWWFIGGILYSKVLAFIGVQIGLHRYFAHRSFVTGKLRHIFLCWVSALTGEGSPTAWSMIHQHHHKNSDNDYDVHSPRDGFWHAALFWPLKSREWYASRKAIWMPIAYVKDPYINFVHQYYGIIWIILIGITLAIDWKVTVFLLLLPAGFATINSNLITNVFCHMQFPGNYRTFDLHNDSTNNKWLQMYQWGEGLHNNHHKFPQKYTQAYLPDEFDPAAWAIEKFFLVKASQSKYTF